MAVTQSEVEFSKEVGKGKLIGVPPAAKAIIEGLQPFAVSRPPDQDLHILTRMNNLDKHNTIHVVAPTVSALIRPGSGGPIWRNVAARDAYSLGSGNDVEMQSLQTSDVVFADAGPWEGKSVTLYLNDLINYVEEKVFPALAAFV